jgi:hypothetical protein
MERDVFEFVRMQISAKMIAKYERKWRWFWERTGCEGDCKSLHSGDWIGGMRLWLEADQWVLWVQGMDFNRQATVTCAWVAESHWVSCGCEDNRQLHASHFLYWFHQKEAQPDQAHLLCPVKPDSSGLCIYFYLWILKPEFHKLWMVYPMSNPKPYLWFSFSSAAVLVARVYSVWLDICLVVPLGLGVCLFDHQAKMNWSLLSQACCSLNDDTSNFLQ